MLPHFLGPASDFCYLGYTNVSVEPEHVTLQQTAKVLKEVYVEISMTASVHKVL